MSQHLLNIALVYLDTTGIRNFPMLSIYSFSKKSYCWNSFVSLYTSSISFLAHLIRRRMRQQERRVYPKMNSIAPVVLSSWWNQQQFNAATGILMLESLRGQTYGTQGELVCLFARLFVQNFLITGLQDFVSFRAKQGTL